MRVKEFLCEMSAIGPGVGKTLRKKGYTLLGKGMDMQAWLEPGTGLVLKILGFGLTRHNKLSGLSRPQESFKKFADYCQAHSNNPFLPDFFGWERFTFEEELYLQIRMERLFPIKKTGWGEALETMSEAADHDGSDNGKNKFLNEYFPKKDPEWAYDGTPYEEVLTHIGKNGFDLLWKTLNDIGKIADRNRYILDLHGGNFMLGRDSQIVISDPFYIL